MRMFTLLLMGNHFMTRGKVVLVKFPFDDLLTSKVRPAVCLTNPIGSHSHVILAFISSRIPSDLLETDLIINTLHEDFGETGLKVTSTLRLHRLMTVTTLLCQRELGELSPKILGEVNNKPKKLFCIK